MNLTSSHKVVRESTQLCTPEVPKCSMRVMRNGQIFIEPKEMSLSDYENSMPDADMFKLGNVVASGINPQMVNPTIIDGGSSEFTQPDNDVALSRLMSDIDYKINESQMPDANITDNSSAPADSTSIS